jgi:polygalacturonase
VRKRTHEAFAAAETAREKEAREMTRVNLPLKPPAPACLVRLLAASALVVSIAACRPEAAPVEGWDLADAIVDRIKPPVFPERDFNIVDYGAMDNGVADCSEALRKAVEACGKAGGGRVVVPAGRFLSGPIHLMSNVNLHLEEGATILFRTDPEAYEPLVRTRWEGVECMNYSPMIYAYRRNNVAITGKGTLDGQADNEHWWPWAGEAEFGHTEGQPDEDAYTVRLLAMAERNVPAEKRIMGPGSHLRPHMIQFHACDNVLVEGVTLTRSPMFGIHPLLCRNVTVRDVTFDLQGPGNSGCCPESSVDVLVEDCFFDVRSECVALKSGSNQDGRRLNRPVENVVVRNCRIKGGRAGLAIGDEITGGARNVFAEKLEVVGPNVHRIVRIKTNSLRGGTIENVYLRRMRIDEVEASFFMVDLYYEEGDRGPFAPLIRGLHLNEIVCQKSRHGVFAKGYKREPIRDLSIEDCAFNNARNGNVLENISGLRIGNVTVDGRPFEADGVQESVADSDEQVDEGWIASVEARYECDFERPGGGAWMTTKGDWAVIDDNGNAVYATIGEEENRSHAGEVLWRDYRVEARVKVNAFNGENRVYLCGRYLDGNNYYAAAIYNRDTGAVVELHRKFEKRTLRLSREPIEFAKGEWYRLALEMRGENLRVLVNDVPKIDLSDDTFKTGGIALLTVRSQAMFDDVKVTPLD